MHGCSAVMAELVMLMAVLLVLLLLPAATAGCRLLHAVPLAITIQFVHLSMLHYNILMSLVDVAA